MMTKQPTFERPPRRPLRQAIAASFSVRRGPIRTGRKIAAAIFFAGSGLSVVRIVSDVPHVLSYLITAFFVVGGIVGLVDCYLEVSERDKALEREDSNSASSDR